jgi:KilA-N domain
MTARILTFKRSVNGVFVEQRVADGFINGTAMCVAHGKDISDWLKTDDTWELVKALAADLAVQAKSHKSGNSVYTRVSASYPTLVTAKRGSPDNGGGTWLHPDLALQLAQWCNKPFAIQVSRWIREWLVTGKNPIQPDMDQEFIVWQERYDIRIYLKDFLRPELMRAVINWAENHNINPRTLCAQVHDTMNERIQGAKAQQIRLMGGLPLGVLIRDYFGAVPLVDYSAINKLAKNAIQDRGVDPIAAVHEACDCYLGKAYVPKLTRILENVHSQGRRLGDARKKRQMAAQQQLTIWDLGQAI